MLLLLLLLLHTPAVQDGCYGAYTQVSVNHLSLRAKGFSSRAVDTCQQAMMLFWLTRAMLWLDWLQSLCQLIDVEFEPNHKGGLASTQMELY